MDLAREVEYLFLVLIICIISLGKFQNQVIDLQGERELEDCKIDFIEGGFRRRIVDRRIYVGR